MADNEMKVSLAVEVDRASIEKAKQALQGVSQSTQQAMKAASSASGQATAALVKNNQKIIKSYDELATEAGAAVNKLEAQLDAFDETSKKVSLAGDLESNLRTVGGAIGAAGGTQASAAIGAVAEIPAVIEALPRLKEAFMGLPQTLSAAASSLGPVGLAVGAGIAAIVVATGLYAEEATKRAAEITRAGEAIRETRRAVAEGLTTQEANAQLAQLTRLREQEAAQLAQTQAGYDAAINSMGLLGAGLKAVTFEEEAMYQQLIASRDAVSKYDQQINQLTGAMEAGALAANDAANALRSNLDAQQSVISDLVSGMTSIEAQGLIERARLNAQYQQAEIARLQALLETISASDPKYSAVTDAIATANSNLEAAQGQIEAYSEALRSGKFANNDAKAAAEEAEKANRSAASSQKEASRAVDEGAKAAEEAARKQEQAQEAARNAQNKYTDAIDNATRSYTDKLADIRQKLKDNMADLSKSAARDAVDMARKNQQAVADAEQDFRDKEAQRLIDHQRNLQQIRRDAQKSERDAIRNQDALALALAREQAQEQISEAEEANKEQGQDAVSEYQKQQRDLQTALQRERQEKAIAQQRAIQDAREAANREIRDAGVARQRALQMAQEAYSKELALLREKFAAEIGMYQQAARAAGAAGGAPASSGGGTGPVTTPSRGRQGGFSIVINGAMNPNAVSNAVVQQLGRVGLT